MDFRALFILVRPWLWLVALSVVVAAGAGLLFSRAMTPTYESQATVLVGQVLETPAIDYNDILAAKELAQTYAQLATTGPVLTRAAARLSQPMDLATFGRSVHVRAPASSTFVEIVGQATSATLAAEIANAVADELLASAPAVATPAPSRAPSPTPRPTTSPESSERATPAPSPSSGPQFGTGSLTIVEPAAPPREPSSPRVLLNVGIASVVGFIFGAGLVALLVRMRVTLG